MRIDETKVFLFSFKTDQGDIQFPMRAESRDEAGKKMQQTLQRMNIELSMDFPKIQINQTEMGKNLVDVLNEPINIPTNIPPEVLELRIDTLLGDMGAGSLKGKAKDDTIKLWTGFDFNGDNYTKIIAELELIQSGKKEIPKK